MKIITKLKSIKPLGKAYASYIVKEDEWIVKETNNKGHLKYVAKCTREDGGYRCGRSVENIMKNLSNGHYATYDCILVK